MSNGVHARPNPRGGGLTALLAVLIGGAGFAYALSPGGERSVRLGVLGLSLLMVLQLLVVSGQQRTVTRTLARTQERLRILELRTRAEGDELHHRVLEGIKREGLLLDAVTSLSGEIARLRVLLEAASTVLPSVAPLVAAAPAAVTSVPVVAEPEVAVVEPGVVPVVPALPLVPLAPLVPAAAAAAAEAAPAQAPAEALVAAQAAELVPAGEAPRPYVPTVPVTTWVVREIQVEGEPGAAVSMRILDLTDSGAESDLPEWPTPAAAWGQYARPA